MKCSPNYTFVLLSRRLIIIKQYLYYSVLLSLGIYCYFLFQCDVYSLKVCVTKPTAPVPGTSSLFTGPIEPNHKMMLCIFRRFALFTCHVPYISKYYSGINFHFHCNRKKLIYDSELRQNEKV
jgi:hypothetical protein